jgi:lipopolysaccharide/colanic/teichoic acid biosynthesis glycosyltransferase
MVRTRALRAKGTPRWAFADDCWHNRTPVGWASETAARPAERPGRWLRRRVVADRALAVVAGIVVAPVTALLAAFVRLVDRGPALVGLARVGEGGRPFTMWKLRTMRDADGEAASFTVVDDPRVTGLGRWLRRYRLDELPQLWNVARGEMALLGPRPEAPEYVDEGDERWRAALATRPGIAGPTQVVIHRWEATIDTIESYVEDVLPHKLAIDGWYVSHASPAVDLDVLRSVLRSLVAPRSPTAVHRRLRRELPTTMAAIDDATGRP